jgi:dephospho-CoA kinase
MTKHLALTGNVGSGKSTVAKLLAEKGAVIIDADILAREAIELGTTGFDAVVDEFGQSILDENGNIDRAALRRRVFNDPEERSALNAIVHPRVGILREQHLQRAIASGARVIVSDIPLLFEVGLEHAFDGVIFVDASEDVRLQRLLVTRDLTEPEVRAIMAAQWPSERKRKLATWVIDNNGSRDQLAAQVDSMWNSITSLTE